MRSRSEKIIAGVAGGIGQYLAVDPVLVRLAFVALGLSGIGLLLYPVMWLIMPLEGAAAPAPGQAMEEMRQQAARVGQEVREVIVAPRGARRARFDPMTGQPLDEGEEIPINNVGGESAANAQDRRNRLLGVLLVGIGAFVAVNVLAPGLNQFLVPALLIIGGVLLLRRGR
jgi:phage shock protein C